MAVITDTYDDGTTSYVLSDRAYLKMFFHASKHPHKPVNGVLLGKTSSSGAVAIEDSIPLLHHWTSLSPMMEIGLDLGHAKSLGLQLVGYYQACQRVDDTALAPVGEKVAGSIRAEFKDAVAFVIDGQTLGSNKPALIPYLAQSSSTWRPQSSGPEAFSSKSRFTLASDDSPLRAVTLVLEDSLHQKLGDFDDHLEDVSIDWLRNASCLQDVL